MTYKNIVKDFAFSLLANLITFISNIVLVLLLPKILPVKEYGYWQLYLLYSSYIGFFHFGWINGYCIKNAGKRLNELNKEMAAVQFWALFIFEFILTLTSGILVFNFLPGGVEKMLYLLVIINIIIVVPKTMLLYIQQVSGEIKKYSSVLISERIVYSVSILFVLFIGKRDLMSLAFSDIFAKLFSFISLLFLCKNIIFRSCGSFLKYCNEIKENINIGIKVMLSEISGMLILGVIRLVIERKWGIETFGNISFALSIINILILFVNSLGIVLYPQIGRLKGKDLKESYIILSEIVNRLLVLGLFAFYPAYMILGCWIPQYSMALEYLGIIFPMCIFEAKMILLLSHYYKVLRFEKIYLWINLVCLILIILFSIMDICFINSMELMLISIPAIYMVRCWFGEYFLNRYFQYNGMKKFAIYVGIAVMFILINQQKGLMGLGLLFSGLYLMILILKRRYLKGLFVRYLEIIKY